MTGQLASRHFLRARDRVQHIDGRTGEVVESLSLYALVRWDDGLDEEVDQFDPRIVVTERAANE